MSRPQLVILGVKMTGASVLGVWTGLDTSELGVKRRWYREWRDSSRNLEQRGQGEGKDFPNSVLCDRVRLVLSYSVLFTEGHKARR